MRLRTEVRRCEFGFPYALAQESVEGLTKEDICTPNTESASTLTITLATRPEARLTTGSIGVKRKGARSKPLLPAPSLGLAGEPRRARASHPVSAAPGTASRRARFPLDTRRCPAASFIHRVAHLRVMDMSDAPPSVSASAVATAVKGALLPHGPHTVPAAGTDSLPRATGPEKAAWILMAAGLLFILHFKLVPALVAGLCVYGLIHVLTARLAGSRLSHSHAKIVVVSLSETLSPTRPSSSSRSARRCPSRRPRWCSWCSFTSWSIS